MVNKQTAQQAIEVSGLKKSYGELKVLKGINFSVKHGQILALLGPNGAGKTTTIRILSTLLRADAGKALINGFDIEEQIEEVKASIGLTGQYAAVDEYLTGAENLLLMGRLYRLSNTDNQRRTDELLELFDLVKASIRPVKTYSGGMRRRLDLAMSLIASPPIIFLDEPTTGLDPGSRQTMWEMIRELAASGTTILLTTQYMEEADYLADNIIVIDGGRVIAEGTASALKAKVGSDRLEIVVTNPADVQAAVKLIGRGSQVDKKRRSISLPSRGGVAKFRDVTSKLENAGIKVDSFSLHRPTLDDAFLTLTGHKATVATAKKTKRRGKK